MVVGTVVQQMGVAPASATFESKENPLNTLFVKRGWFWTIAFLSVYLVTSWLNLANRHTLQHSVYRISLATAYWFMLTQQFLGDAILHRILVFTGECSDSRFSAFHECRSQGEVWVGFDVSGHCLLLILSSLLIINELRLLNSASNRSSKDASLFKLLHSFASIALVMLVVLWWIMLVATSLYFHSVLEKVVGSCLAIAFSLIVYHR